MKTIKINFKYFCVGFDPEDNFFTNILRKYYKVIISENPEYMFYSTYPGTGVKNVGSVGGAIKKISPSLYLLLKKIFTKIVSILRKKNKVEGNFVKILFSAEHIKPDLNDCDWAFGSWFEEEVKDSRYVRIPPYMYIDHKLVNEGLPPEKKKINFKKIKKEKTKFCNFIYSQDVPARNEFFKRLNKYNPVDAPGRCMNNMPAISADNPKQSRLSRNWPEEKLNFIKKYKFTIAFENAFEPGNVTEKLTQPMLVNSLPIYVGDKFVSRDFSTKSFLNYHDFRNMDDFIKFIIKVDKDDVLWEKILREPWYAKDNSKRSYSKARIIKRLREIFG
jgi:alpha(1,3/1,4) fucosyltransferase